MRIYRLSYSLCDNFNLYSSDRSWCPLRLCGSLHSLLKGPFKFPELSHQYSESDRKGIIFHSIAQKKARIEI
ncbi:MAG: hypothetical protein EWV50_16575 [Microcystis aeruginosa Ma_MB_F_20061100_S20]|uniref:Uncharacterized protein n=1 Tax=Microcystis aeruginosa Ma_MB_F_20061100_S20D TaxID=2486253 RepID=A0A552ET70_MICAE|nr:MAG: hypothetical protein EWV50_16575 [Microcystis aeruginosa Ma_MB_F_20061100_S20]TRU37656.1 MAG: hypothetical protein EWV78_06690 [Microcystis aeruginosa Ma_MB_F_20061100_S20D]